MSNITLSEKEAHGVCNEALALKDKIEASFIHLGKYLYEIKSARLFEAGWESWGEFLMDMKMSEAMASKLITIYQVFVLDFKIKTDLIAEAGGWTVVYDLIPLAKDKESALKWLRLAKDMTRMDIKKEAALGKGEKEPEDCDHEWCKMCGKCKMKYDE